MRISTQECFRRHDHAGRAEPALRTKLLVKSTLEPIGAALLYEAFDGLDGAFLAASGKHYARRYSFTIDQDRACAAFAAIASDLHAGQARNVAQIIYKQLIVRHGVFTPATIEFQPEQSLPRLRALFLHDRFSTPSRAANNDLAIVIAGLVSLFASMT
jgi:hypothetical protein